MFLFYVYIIVSYVSILPLILFQIYELYEMKGVISEQVCSESSGEYGDYCHEDIRTLEKMMFELLWCSLIMIVFTSISYTFSIRYMYVKKSYGAIITSFITIFIEWITQISFLIYISDSNILKHLFDDETVLSILNKIYISTIFGTSLYTPVGVITLCAIIFNTRD